MKDDDKVEGGREGRNAMDDKFEKSPIDKLLESNDPYPQCIKRGRVIESE
jgi:hypothetical protein